jgi:hypothetical protein
MDAEQLALPLDLRQRRTGEREDEAMWEAIVSLRRAGCAVRRAGARFHAVTFPDGTRIEVRRRYLIQLAGEVAAQIAAAAQAAQRAGGLTAPTA